MILLFTLMLHDFTMFCVARFSIPRLAEKLNCCRILRGAFCSVCVWCVWEGQRCNYMNREQRWCVRMCVCVCVLAGGGGGVAPVVPWGGKSVPRGPQSPLGGGGGVAPVVPLGRRGGWCWWWCLPGSPFRTKGRVARIQMLCE